MQEAKRSAFFSAMVSFINGRVSVTVGMVSAFSALVNSALAKNASPSSGYIGKVMLISTSFSPFVVV